jgi:hypothetical protein
MSKLDASITVLIDGHPAHFGTPNASPGVQACWSRGGPSPFAAAMVGRDVYATAMRSR